jgi:hypothetical protein
MSRANGRTSPPAKPVHAYLSSISIENIKCFGPKQTLDLKLSHTGGWGRWTVILGDNGLGKTTMLRSIAAASPMVQQAQGGPDPTTMASALLWGWHWAWPDVQLSSRRASIHGTWTATAGNAFGLGVSFGVGTRMGGGLDPEWEARLFAYGASRAMGRRSLTPEESPDPVATLFSTDAQLLNPIEWLQRLDYDRLKGDRAAEKQLRQVMNVLTGGLLPDVTHLQVLGTKGVLATTPFGDVPLDQLGLGYQTVLAWLVDLVWRMFTAYPDLEDPLSGPATVLVDEIDLHLHPRWQRQIIDHLTKWFPNTQWIVTAHSPLIVQAAEDANIAVLRREGDHVVIDQAPDKIRNWRVDQILTSDLFGLPTARPVRLEKLLDEREQLLSKKRKTAKDKQRIAAIEAEVNELDTAETPADREAMELIRRAAEILKS